ncbi:MAG: FMN-binding protein [Fibrobacter sp.]|nr:FMN-binding protein [Fibrobacter sp.]
MSENMGSKEIFNITWKLVLTYIIGGLLIVAVYAKTIPIIAKNANAKKMSVLMKMFDGADKVELLSEWTAADHPAEIFKVFGKDGALLGYVVESYGKGYSSFIHTMLAVDKDQKITNISVLGHAETPGLGDVVETPDFQKRFYGKGAANMEIVKSEGTDKIQAVSGATISSRAVVNGQRDGLIELSKVLQNQAGE